MSEVTGYPAKTKMGELSIVPVDMRILAPCLWTLPLQNSLMHKETRYRKRFIDLLVNPETRKVFKIRSKVTMACWWMTD